MVEAQSSIEPCLNDESNDTSSIHHHPLSDAGSVRPDALRISSTPPSTPGLELTSASNSVAPDDHFHDSYDDDDDEYLIDYDSPPEEDYFFNDFVNGSDEDKEKEAKKKKRQSKRGGKGVKSRFDLQAFAQHLHSHRLSVIQARQSGIHLTEDDEKELERLLARKQSDASALGPLPPLPNVPDEPLPASPSPAVAELDADDDLIDHNSKPVMPVAPPESAPAPAPAAPDDHSGKKATVIEPQWNPDLVGRKPSLLLQKLGQRSSTQSKGSLLVHELPAPLSPSLSDPASFTLPRKAPSPPPGPPKSPRADDHATDRQSTFTLAPPADKKPEIVMPKLKKKTSWLTLRQKKVSSSSSSSTAVSKPSPLSQEAASATVSKRMSPPHAENKMVRRSMSLDTLCDLAKEQERDQWKAAGRSTRIMVTPATTSNEEHDETNDEHPSPQTSASSTRQSAPAPPRLGLFGSLRQASRSSRSIRGLMRNLSSVGHRTSSPSSSLSSTSSSSTASNSLTVPNASSALAAAPSKSPLASNVNDETTDNGTMSRAAMAALQHDINRRKSARKSGKSTTTTSDENAQKKHAQRTSNMSHSSSSKNSQTSHEMDVNDGVDDTTEQVTHTATSAKGGIRLLSSLLAKARSSSSAKNDTKKSTTKTVNLDHLDASSSSSSPAEDDEKDNKSENNHSRRRNNKVIRRTIIYVQPDALDFLKKEGQLPPMPPVPPKKDQAKRATKDTTIEQEYATATKLTRQVSRRKRLVEENTLASSPLSSSSSPLSTPMRHPDHQNDKKWRLESISDLDVGHSKDSLQLLKDQVDDLVQFYGDEDEQGDETAESSQLEGLELREMSDGSVVWGIVKKQGNRKSFCATKALESMMDQQYLHHNNNNNHNHQHDADMADSHEDIEKSVLALMGLAPDSLNHLPTSPPTSPHHPSHPPHPAHQRPAVTRRAGQPIPPVAAATTAVPPPIPKRSPRRRTDSHQKESKQDIRNQRALSVEEQLDEMMHSIAQPCS
ncbi:hypothetical protein BC940DRAFT_330612 [Gongronella butleri]|nr:hypothetical protein BC940DRAFT_330612 [Gongronella butleri]